MLDDLVLPLCSGMKFSRCGSHAYGGAAARFTFPMDTRVSQDAPREIRVRTLWFVANQEVACCKLGAGCFVISALPYHC